MFRPVHRGQSGHFIPRKLETGTCFDDVALATQAGVRAESTRSDIVLIQYWWYANWWARGLAELTAGPGSE